MKPRYVILIDGKWQGGSFASEAEAKAVAQELCKGTSKKFRVEPKSVLSKPAAPSA